MADSKTQPRYWFQVEPRPTEELTHILEQGPQVDPSNLNHELIEQILMARHVIEPSGAFQRMAKMRANGDSFCINERIGAKMLRRWDVVLTGDLAVFVARDGGEHFTLRREDAQSEVQFGRRGFLWLKKGQLTQVQGKTFDFNAHKDHFVAWLHPVTNDDFRQTSTLWGIGMILLGGLSLILNPPLEPFMSGILFLLGLMTLFARNREIFFFIGLSLAGVGSHAFTLGILSLFSKPADLSVPALWVLLGGAMLALGIGAYRKQTLLHETLTEDVV